MRKPGEFGQLGGKDVEKVLEVELDDAERQGFQTSVDHVKELVKGVKV